MLLGPSGQWRLHASSTLFVSCLFAVSISPFVAAKESIDFTSDIEPILKKHCQACHGVAAQMGGLRLDRRDDALRGGYSGKVILPGKSNESRLWQLVAGQVKGLRMPMGSEPLESKEISLIRAWIDEGAAWPAPGKSAVDETQARISHWAVQPVRKPGIPAVRDMSWVRNEIDSFILAKLDEVELRPSPAADRPTLARRLSLDIVGLPIDVRDMNDFLSDGRPDAYERLVDRLLQSPHYGEKWARYWLDLARYGDSDGYSRDSVRPFAWRYRHWVVEALNRDMPFDKFTVEQIAGDLLPDATTEQKIATGFHRNSLTNREAGVNLEQTLFEQAVDRTDAFGVAWLGLTVGCARCHDHKYDPITQKDYYQLLAYFENVEDLDIAAPLPGELGPYLRALPDFLKKREKLFAEHRVHELQEWWEGRLLEAAEHPGKEADWDFVLTQLGATDLKYRVLKKDPATRTIKEREFVTERFFSLFRLDATKKRYEENNFQELVKQFRKLQAEFPDLSQAQTIAESSEEPKTNVRIRGEYSAKGIEVRASTPHFLTAPGSGGAQDRLALARWLVAPENPLTARVVVNRVWQELFGRGIVQSSENFGVQGEKPSHPELLDWLAAEFQDLGWSTKELVRRIVTSATYRQSSKLREDCIERDPKNILIARQSRLRLRADLIRDSALAASGLLNSAIGGPTIAPPLPAGVADLAVSQPNAFWSESKGSERYRRGLYIQTQRTVPYPSLLNFDAPDSTTACSRRERSNTPLQALNLLNDPVFFEAAVALADRLLRESPSDFEARLRHAYLITLARSPKPVEIEAMRKYFVHRTQAMKKQPEVASSVFPAAQDVDSIGAASWVGVSRVLLNLDEFITRE